MTLIPILVKLLNYKLLKSENGVKDYLSNSKIGEAGNWTPQPLWKEGN